MGDFIAFWRFDIWFDAKKTVSCREMMVSDDFERGRLKKVFCSILSYNTRFQTTSGLLKE